MLHGLLPQKFWVCRNYLNRMEWKILLRILRYFPIFRALRMCWLSMKISFQRGVIKREVPEFLAFWKPLLSFILFKWFSKVQFTIFLLVSLVKKIPQINISSSGIENSFFHKLLKLVNCLQSLRETAINFRIANWLLLLSLSSAYSGWNSKSR